MSERRLWDRCVNHRGVETERFVSEYFSNADHVLLIGGIGFDPRSTTVCTLLAPILGHRLSGLFVREERPDPHGELVKRANFNHKAMTGVVPKCTEKTINIFATDGAVIGGRNAVQALNSISLGEFTDIIVDFSALSIGVAFPITRFLFERARMFVESFNLHLMVTDEPTTDNLVFPTACDIVDTIHGFKGGFGLFEKRRAAKLWLPQLIGGRNAVLSKIHSYCKPHDVCPSGVTQKRPYVVTSKPANEK